MEVDHTEFRKSYYLLVIQRWGERVLRWGGRRDLSNSFYPRLKSTMNTAHVPVKKTLKFDDLQYYWPISAATIETLRRQRRQRLYDRAAGDGRSAQCSAATGVDRTRMASDNPSSPDARKCPCSFRSLAVAFGAVDAARGTSQKKRFNGDLRQDAHLAFGRCE